MTWDPPEPHKPPPAMVPEPNRVHLAWLVPFVIIVSTLVLFILVAATT